jgi:hypothetical protein
MPNSSPRWDTRAVLAVGLVIRVWFGLMLPPRFAYDDHYPPIRIIAHERRLPRPDECWECYQPPMYYLVAAATYVAAEKAAAAGGSAPPNAAYTARKSVQLLSVASGCLTLLICLAIARRSGIGPAWTEPIVLGAVAFLPQHIYMSVMATNDAMTYLIASLAIWATLRAQAAHWPVYPTALAGALAGAAILCKGYGMMTALTIVVVGTFFIWRGPPRPEPPTASRWHRLFASLALVGSCAVVGCGPAVRNLARYHKPQQFSDSAMHTQPPGSVPRLEFTSFRFPDLVRRPWIHVSHLESFWTELYARYWFDYEGLRLTLALSPQWRRHMGSLQLAGGDTFTLEDWETLLKWDTRDVPQIPRLVAIVSYLAGLPITACILAGALLALRRLGRDFSASLMLIHLTLCLAVPVGHVIQWPVFSAMKSAYTLSAISSVPVLIALLLGGLRIRIAIYIAAILCLALLALVLCNFALVGWVDSRIA